MSQMRVTGKTRQPAPPGYRAGPAPPGVRLKEWRRAAAERFGAKVANTGGADPAARWVAQFEWGVTSRGASDPALRPPGGLNPLGGADMAGNVWEWTTGCVLNEASTPKAG